MAEPDARTNVEEALREPKIEIQNFENGADFAQNSPAAEVGMGDQIPPEQKAAPAEKDEHMEGENRKRKIDQNIVEKYLENRRKVRHLVNTQSISALSCLGDNCLAKNQITIHSFTCQEKLQNGIGCYAGYHYHCVYYCKGSDDFVCLRCENIAITGTKLKEAISSIQNDAEVGHEESMEVAYPVGNRRCSCGPACKLNRPTGIDYWVKCSDDGVCSAEYHEYCLLEASRDKDSFTCIECNKTKTHTEWRKYARDYTPPYAATASRKSSASSGSSMDLK